MKLEDVRRQYTKGKLDLEDLEENPFQQFKRWMEQAVEAQLSADPTAMTLATVDSTGQPSQRIVLLKHLDENGFVFYTNLGSKKAQDIANNSKVSLHFAWLGLERQVRINGLASKLSITEATRYFMSRPKESRLAAWASQQSQPIGSRKLLEQAFEQMKFRFKKGDIPLPSFWGGYRVQPTEIEFWQGRENRLHDRFQYVSLQETGWKIERLQP